MTGEETNSPKQFGLELTLNNPLHFDNFLYEDASNAMAINALKSFASVQGVDDTLLIWGEYGSGLTHLLEAVCLHAQLSARPFMFIDLETVINHTPQDVLEGVEQLSLVCIDNFHVVEGAPQWQRAIFHLYNNLRDSGHGLVLASHVQPVTLDLSLPDLTSRVLGCSTYQISPLSDEKKQELLVNKANARGLELPLDVARFILERAPREPKILSKIIGQLDQASLEYKRKLTVPFVKTVLGL